MRKAHDHSSHHRAEVVRSTKCGCFYCGKIFAPTEIEEWIDGNDSGMEQTALCPKCGIDSVIGDRSGYAITEDFLKTMYQYWFDVS